MSGGDMTEPDSADGPLDRNDSTLLSRLRTGYDSFQSRNRRAETTLNRAWRHSRIAVVADRINQIIQNAQLYRWLTTRPDKRSISIDLRDSYVAGPILALVERLYVSFNWARYQDRIDSIDHKTSQMIAANHLRFASTILLGFVLTALLLTWQGASTLWLTALGLASVSAAIGIIVNPEAPAVSNSRLVASVAAVLQLFENKRG